MKQIDIRAATMKLAMDQLRSIGSQLYNKQHSGVHTSATVANQIATGDWGNSHAPGSGQFRDQTAQTTNPNFLTGGFIIDLLPCVKLPSIHTKAQ